MDYTSVRLCREQFAGPYVPYTRITEYKHKPTQPESVRGIKVCLLGVYSSSELDVPSECTHLFAWLLQGTVIYKEYSTDDGDPYYPVPNPENRALYEKYRDMAEKEEGVAFVGRLASYKYFNMDQAILNALEIYDNLKETGKLAPKRRPEDFGPGDGPKWAANAPHNSDHHNFFARIFPCKTSNSKFFAVS